MLTKSLVLDATLLVLTELSPGEIGAFKQGLNEALSLQDLEEDTSHSEVEHIKSSVQDEGLCQHSPLVLDLNGDGLAISNVGNGVAFDLLARGNSVRTAWIQDDDALLVLDVNGNGVIDSGSELFGNTGGHANGFAGGVADHFADPSHQNVVVHPIEKLLDIQIHHPVFP